MDLKYNPLPLADMAARRLSADLFKKPTVLSSISNFHSEFSLSEEIWSLRVWQQTVEVKLLDEIIQLQLPETLSNMVSIISRLMGEHVKNWKELHEMHLYHSEGEDICFDVPVLEKLRWTRAGAIDYRKTAEELVQSDSIDVVKKFKLACLYCLEDFIPVLWKNLPKESQRYFCSKAGIHLQRGGLGQEFWWPYIIEGKESQLDNLTEPYRRVEIKFHQYAFQLSVEKGNKTAVEYYFRKLSNQEKDACLMSSSTALIQQYAVNNIKAFPNEKFSELLGFLLSLMTPYQRMQFFQDIPFEFFDLFLVWPFQDLFLVIAESIKDFFPEENLDVVLYMMYDNFEIFGDYSASLFRDFFLRIPSDFWINFVNRQCVSGSYFDDILYHRDTRVLEIFSRSLSSSARKRLVFSEFSLNAFKKFLSEGKQDVVEVCLREANLSREDKEKLKKIFKVNKMKFKTRKWSGLSYLLNETNDDGKK